MEMLRIHLGFLHDREDDNSAQLLNSPLQRK
jgi:hypothetical protein